MVNSINLSDMERKAFRSTFEDGLLELLIMCFTLQFALAPYLSQWGMGDFWSSAIFMPLYLIALVGYVQGKKHMTAPRVGLATYSEKRRTKIRKLNFYLAFMVLAGIFMGVIALQFTGTTLATWLFPAVMSFLLLFAFSMAGYYLDVPRLFYYGVLLSLLVPLGEVLFWRGYVSHHGYPLVFGIGTVVLFFNGIFHLVRFMTKYKIPEQESAHGKS
ncbi:MAG: hypothetical protein ACOY90_09890 [Candidatus Zhuqueibacterota bacterium]